MLSPESVLTFSQVLIQLLSRAVVSERRYLEQRALYGSRIKFLVQVLGVIKSSLYTVG